MVVPEPGADPEPAAPRPAEPLPARTVAAVAVVVALITVGALVALLWWVSLTDLTGADLTTARLDAIRIGLSIAVGGGGVFALFLAWRRQRSTEADHLQRERSMAHQRQVAVDSSYDALERRTTELYTKSAELLGSDKAPVRLAGIYALERLGQGNPDQRQTVVNVFCAYLRTPGGLDDQERQVRSTTQRVLTNHLDHRSTRGANSFWPDIELDLTGTTLLDFDFSSCVVRHARFDDAEFRGATSFLGAGFADGVSWQRARFDDEVSFGYAQLTGARFDDARFEKGTKFNSTVFASPATFDRARFAGLTSFDGATFGGVDFSDTEFESATFFRGVAFTGPAVFAGARFGDSAVFDDSTFHALASLALMVFADSAVFSDVEFLNGATFRGTDFQGNAMFGGSVFHRHSNFTDAFFGRWANFNDVRFGEGVDVYPALARIDVLAEDRKRAWPREWLLVEPEKPADGKIRGHEGIWGRVYDTTMFQDSKE